MSIDDETPEGVAAGADDRFGAFRNTQYLRYWLARLGASFAVQIVAVLVAIALMLYWATGKRAAPGLPPAALSGSQAT